MRRPVQARSRRTAAALVDAAAGLMAERPFGTVSVQELAARAGVTTGAFYARFASKEEVLHALHQRTLEGMSVELQEVQPPPPEGSTGGALERWVAGLLATLRRHAPRLSEIRRSISPPERPAYDARTRAFHDQVTGEIRARLRTAGAEGEITHPQAGLAANLALFFTDAILREAVLENAVRTWPVAIDDRVLAREVTLAITRYLGLATEPARRTTRVT